MKAYLYYGPGDFRLEEVPTPKVGRGEVLVRVVACAVCGTDLRIYRSGHRKVTPPHIIGHEVAGVVEEVGEGVEEYRKGERVLLVTEVGCNKCRWCIEGRKNLCPDMRAFGYYYPGGFAEYLKIPSEAVEQSNLIPFSESLTFEEASLVEPLSCCVNGQDYLDIGIGEDVVIIGVGPIGLLHLKLARSKGAGRIILVDISSERLKLAEKFSPDHIIDASQEDPREKVKEITGGKGADVVIVACSSPQAQGEALGMVGVRGRVSFFGGLPRDKSRVTLDTNIIHYQEVSVFGAYSSSHQHYHRALRMVEEGRIQLKDIITHTYPLEGLKDAFKTLGEGKAIKAVIKP